MSEVLNVKDQIFMFNDGKARVFLLELYVDAEVAGANEDIHVGQMGSVRRKEVTSAVHNSRCIYNIKGPSISFSFECIGV